MATNPPSGSDDDDTPDTQGRTDDDKADDKADDRSLGSLDAVRSFLLVAAGVALALPIVFALQAPQAIDKIAIAAAGVTIGAAAMAVGGLFGFVFGIPTTVQLRGADPQNAEGAGNNEPGPLYVGNTSLEQISDWLTKILVGVGLTQLSSIPTGLAALGEFLAGGLGNLPGSNVFATSLVVFGLTIGFFLAYLWTRLELPYLSARSYFKQLLAGAKDQGRHEGEKEAFNTLAPSTPPKGGAAVSPEEPAEGDLAAPGEAEAGFPAGASGPTATPPITALWVDDRPENNDSVRHVIEERFGVNFETALSTEQAIAKLTGPTHYAFVITDVSRPPDRRAGFTLLGQMQARGIYLPTIIFTGKSVSREFAAEAERLNAEAITNSPSELFKVVQRLVGRIRMT